MKLLFLAWLFILCSHDISNLAFQDAPTTQHEDFTLSKKQEQVRGLEGKVGLSGEDEKREYKQNQELFHFMKGRKGGHGSSNIVHRPDPKQRNAATLVAKPVFFLSATMVSLSLAWGIIFFRL